jgi:hypothetical protein
LGKLSQKALKTQKMGKAKAFWAGADFDASQKALKVWAS